MGAEKGPAKKHVNALIFILHDTMQRFSTEFIRFCDLLLFVIVMPIDNSALTFTELRVFCD